MRHPILLIGCCAVFAACSGNGSGPASAVPAGKNPGQSAARSALPKYSIIDLGVNVIPVRINAKNHIAGTLGDTWHVAKGGFFYDGTLHVLGGIATDMNNNDKVVGNTSSGPAILNHDGSVITLQEPKGYSGGLVATLNDSAKIIGASAPPNSCWPSMVNYRVGKPATVIQTPTSAYPVRVNDIGTILYQVDMTWSGGCENYTYPQLWPGPISIPMPPNDNCGAGLSPPTQQGTDINSAGQVVGYYCAVDGNGNFVGWAGFYYENGATQEIDPPGGLGSSLPTFEPNAINNNDWIVGPVQLSYASTAHAYLWISGTFTDLNSLVSDRRWLLNNAVDVNDAGYVVGVGTLTQSSAQHGFLLVPHS